MKIMRKCIFLTLLCMCMGEGMQSGGGVIWQDDLSLNEFGSPPMIVTGQHMAGYNQPGFPQGQNEDKHEGAIDMFCDHPKCFRNKKGVGIVVGNADETEGNLNSAAEAPLKLLVGRKLSFFCNLTNIADDESKVEWRKDGEEDNVLKEDETNKYKLFDNNTLLIVSAEENDAGTYECRTTGAQSYTKQFSVVYFSWKKLPKSIVVVEGNVVELTCMANGKPMPTVQWFKDAVQLNNSQKYSYKPNDDGIANAVLSFENAQQGDRGTYECRIHTEFGQKNASTFVRVKSALAPLYPAVGIVIEIILLIVVIIFFERRRAKQEYEESDTDQGPDMKNTSESRESVRQRK